MKKKLKIYIETSIISHLDAPDRPDWMAETRKLWKSVVMGKYHVVIGETVFAEIERCHESKRTFMLDRIAEVEYESVDVTAEAKRLAGEYVSMGGLPKKVMMLCT